MLEACICSADPEKKVVALTLLTIDLKLSLVFCLKFLKLSPTLISWIIWSLILFSQITSMAFGGRGQLVTYFPILLIYGLLPLGISVSLVWWRLTYQRLSSGYGMCPCPPSSLIWVSSFPLFTLVQFSLRSFHFDTCRWSDLFLFFCQLWCSSGFCFIANLILTFH